MLPKKTGLRYGVTTGACAAAAVRGALLMLLGNRPVHEVSIEIPAGLTLTLPLCRQEIGENWAACAVIKDAGDDPDITGGLAVHARTEKKDQPGHSVKAGAGVGTVTRPGLQIPPGEGAINPVPRRMIARQVEELLPPSLGVEITLSVPGGEKLAARTFNPRLGIEGGISILGSTGLVEPKSIDAYRVSLALALDMARAAGIESPTLVPGALGERFARDKLGRHPASIVQTGNAVGFMLREAFRRGFKNITLAGHIGKLIKVAAGHFDTSSRTVDGRTETIAFFAAREKADTRLIERLLNTPTAEECVEVLYQEGMGGLFHKIAEHVSARATSHVGGEAKIDAIIYSFARGTIGSTLR